jgi:hypothetical protein
MSKHSLAILYTERSESEKDLGVMIGHLRSVLAEIEGVEVAIEILTSERPIPYSDYQHLVFCGYDHTTLGHIHLAMAATETARITLYDEPGAAIDRELGAIVYRAIDLRRVPGSSATRLVSSWSHRDIIATARQDVLKLSHGTDGSNQPAAGPVDAPSRSGNSGRGSRTRKVETKGNTSARKGDEATGGVGNADIGSPE